VATRSYVITAERSHEARFTDLDKAVDHAVKLLMNGSSNVRVCGRPVSLDDLRVKTNRELIDE